MESTKVLTEIKKLRGFQGEAEEFWRNFLEGVSQLARAKLALLLQKNDQEQSWEFLARGGVVTKAELPDEQLWKEAGDLISSAFERGFAYERSNDRLPGFSAPVFLCFRLESGAGLHQLVLLVSDELRIPQINDILIRLQLVSDIPGFYFGGAGSAVQDNGGLPDVLEIVSAVVSQKKFQLAAMTMVNDLCSRFQCSRVSFALIPAHYAKTVAISHLERFSEKTDAVSDLLPVFEESADQDEEIAIPVVEGCRAVVVAHEKYFRQNGLKQLVSFPLRVAEKVIGVVTLEKTDGYFIARDLYALRLSLNQLAPVLEKMRLVDRWFYERAFDGIKDGLSWFLGMEHTLAKLAAIICSLLLFWVCFGEWPYSIELNGALVTDNVGFVSAPFDGLVFDVRVRAGEPVKKGDVMLVLDTQELYLKETEALSEVSRYEREAQKARADQKLADMNIALAKKEQSQTMLDRVRYFLALAEIKAPFDGIVIEGERENLLGVPVNKGDLLFKVADPVDLYLKLKVPEIDIDEISPEAGGRLALLTNPEQKYSFQIKSIIPMAEVDQSNGNSFSVNAVFLEEPKDWWRPGMSGVAKVDAGKRRIIWILTRRLQAFFKLWLWW